MGRLQWHEWLLSPTTGSTKGTNTNHGNVRGDQIKSNGCGTEVQCRIHLPNKARHGWRREHSIQSDESEQGDEGPLQRIRKLRSGCFWNLPIQSSQGYLHQKVNLGDDALLRARAHTGYLQTLRHRFDTNCSPNYFL